MTFLEGPEQNVKKTNVTLSRYEKEVTKLSSEVKVQISHLTLLRLALWSETDLRAFPIMRISA